MPKNRVIFDTNIYSQFLEAPYDVLLDKIIHSDKIVVYGNTTIRKELRAISTRLEKGSVNFRIAVLHVYDLIVNNHIYQITSSIETLAREYQRDYEGGISKKELWKDFVIVATAAINGLDIITTEDNHSMASEPAKREYARANARHHLPNPKIISTVEFEKLL